MPCTCHALKCVEPGNALALFFLSARLLGVDTIGAFFSLGPRLLASGGERNNGVAAESEFGLGALMFVDIEPGLAGWPDSQEIGRAASRERGCQFVSISVVAGSLKKNNHNT